MCPTDANKADYPLHVRPSIMLVKPGAGTIHLLSLALVYFGSANSHLTLALPDNVLFVSERPQIVWAFFPFFVRTLPCKPQCPADVIERLLELVSLRAEHKPTDNIGNDYFQLGVIIKFANPGLYSLDSSLADYRQLRDGDARRWLQEQAVLFVRCNLQPL